MMSLKLDKIWQNFTFYYFYKTIPALSLYARQIQNLMFFRMIIENVVFLQKLRL